tara:strand:- start:8936 stop:9136 length:201 start_codon:yes stop_codon:yes gene_type:complete
VYFSLEARSSGLANLKARETHGLAADKWEFGDISPHENTAFPYSIVPFRDKYFFVSLELPAGLSTQ